MKSRIFILLAAVWLSAGSLYAQEVDEIITKYLDAMGGIERLRHWETLKGTGYYIMLSQGGKEVPFTTWYKAPVKKRVDMVIEGDTATYSFDGETSWFCDPSKGVFTPVLMPEVQAKNNKDNADEYAFIDYRKKGHSVEYLGKEEFEGHDVYKVKLTRAGGAESYHFFDCNTGHELKIAINAQTAELQQTTEIIECDFRQIEWLVLPFSIETRVNGLPVYKLLIRQAVIDVDIDDAIFSMPETIRKR